MLHPRCYIHAPIHLIPISSPLRLARLRSSSNNHTQAGSVRNIGSSASYPSNRNFSAHASWPPLDHTPRLSLLRHTATYIDYIPQHMLSRRSVFESRIRRRDSRESRAHYEETRAAYVHAARAHTLHSYEESSRRNRDASCGWGWLMCVYIVISRWHGCRGVVRVHDGLGFLRTQVSMCVYACRRWQRPRQLMRARARVWVYVSCVKATHPEYKRSYDLTPSHQFSSDRLKHKKHGLQGRQIDTTITQSFQRDIDLFFCFARLVQAVYL